MTQVVIDNPILNSPFTAPERHFRFDDDGITNEVIEGRRESAYFIPVPRPRKKNAQLQLPETEWTEDKIQVNELVNQIRPTIAKWRQGGYIGITHTTRRLLDHWSQIDRERRLFFCQIEAMETVIFLTEVAKRHGESWIDNRLLIINEEYNAGMLRIAFKMATGTGKTTVMAMLVAWHTLNKLANPQDARFGDAFLITTPGITIRDRLRVLLPTDPTNVYNQLDLVPSDMMQDLSRAKIVIITYHAFKQREQIDASEKTKQILSQGNKDAFKESPSQMVRRICRELGSKKNIIVMNDEAHHCYRHRDADPVDELGKQLKGEEKAEAEARNENARLWFSGLEDIQKLRGIKMIYDLSATPFFLRGSGYGEGIIFPWVVSDFSLIDAIESGIVKVPRVPVADDSMVSQDDPTYRSLWVRIRDELPKKGRSGEKLSGRPILPAVLEGAIQSLYANYEKQYRIWEQNSEMQERGLTPPVFIVVCNNTNVSRLVYQYISGYEYTLEDGQTVVVSGALPLFSNVTHNRWSNRPFTILVDSEELDSGEAMSDDFKKAAAREINEFKNEYRQRFPDRNVDKITDEDILREVMNTVGKAGKLGEQVKCVVSVSMLTEGWDANTVTHILGVRAFGTQLLCEQVIGRGLRRMSYAVNEEGMFDTEYAEVYGVPFSFIPCSGQPANPRPGPMPTRVRALPDRAHLAIEFPHVVGYRYEIKQPILQAEFTDDSYFILSSQIIPTRTENAPIVGKISIHTIDDLKDHREQEIAFLIAKLVLEKYFRGDGQINPTVSDVNFLVDVQMWRFPQILHITKQWMAKYVICKGKTFPQLLFLRELTNKAADIIYSAIRRSAAQQGDKTLLPILQTYSTIGSTIGVSFSTTKETWRTSPEHSHISHVTGDSNWELKFAESLEHIPSVISYVKNQGLGFTIPYIFEDVERKYLPDFIVNIDDGRGREDLLHVIVEVSGERRPDKKVKADITRTLWVPAINNHGGFGRWAFIEITDPWDEQRTQAELLGRFALPTPTLF